MNEPTAQATQWKVFLSRVTIFPVIPPPSPIPTSPVLFHRMWGRDPDSFQKEPNPLVPSVAQGKSDGVIFSCLAQPARIDFNITATPKRDAELALIPEASTVNAELTQMITSVRETLSLSASRIALFVHVLTPARGSEEANNVLARSIPYGLKLSNEEELVLQVNRPYRSHQIPQVEMNAITKWSVDRFQVLTISVTTGGPTGPALAGYSPPSPQIKEVMAASVSFDLNNRPVQAALTGQQQSFLLLEALDTVSKAQRQIGLNIEGF